MLVSFGLVGETEFESLFEWCRGGRGGRGWTSSALTLARAEPVLLVEEGLWSSPAPLDSSELWTLFTGMETGCGSGMGAGRGIALERLEACMERRPLSLELLELVEGRWGCWFA